MLMLLVSLAIIGLSSALAMAVVWILLRNRVRWRIAMIAPTAIVAMMTVLLGIVGNAPIWLWLALCLGITLMDYAFFLLVWRLHGRRWTKERGWNW